MTELISLGLVLVIGLVTGFFDTIIGAGGLISVPALIFLGLPPQNAIATDRFGLLGQTLPTLYKFWKAKKILWKYVPILTVISLIGSIIGANILLNVEGKILQSIIGILLIILLPFIFIKQDIGIKQIKVSEFKKKLGLGIYFLVMIFAGFFGQGTWPFTTYALIFFLGFTMLETIGTGVIPWFVLSLSSVIIFALSGIIDYKIGIVLLIGMGIGSYIGAHVAIKKGDAWLKGIFVVFVIVSAVKLLFFP